jgi:hypothetical protein
MSESPAPLIARRKWLDKGEGWHYIGVRESRINQDNEL